MEEAVIESDESLMRRFQYGDGESFRVLFERYAYRVVNFVHRFLNDREASEDVAQEVFVRIYKARERYDSSRPFRSWIFSIAARLASNRLRDRKLHSQVTLDFKPHEDRHDIPTIDFADKSSPLTDEILEKQQLVQHVQKALAGLPENQRTAVLLARFEEMPYEEIAATMGSSVSSVKSLLFRARQTLKAALTPCVREAR